MLYNPSSRPKSLVPRGFHAASTLGCRWALQNGLATGLARYVDSLYLVGVQVVGWVIENCGRDGALIST